MALWPAIHDTLHHVALVDVIDIALIAYIFYRLALAVRGTRAVSLIKGIVLVLAVLWASNILPTFLGLVDSEDIEKIVNEVMDACEDFVARQIGALIVLEREARLVDITRTGKTIDGMVSSELIATIFAPRSPLHDGAAVIRHDRVVAAGCALPHSENPGLSATTGMRHRAALGLSERTDAVCIVVSEEAACMSLAVEGTLSPSLERIQMVERLLQLFESRRREASFFFWRK